MSPGRLLLLLLLIIILIVEFLNPPLNASEMKWLLALIAVPQCASLIYAVVTYQALLRPLG
jgi:hypothetical protein